MRDIYDMKGMAYLRLAGAAMAKMRWDISPHQAYYPCSYEHTLLFHKQKLAEFTIISLRHAYAQIFIYLVHCMHSNVCIHILIGQ